MHGPVRVLKYNKAQVQTNINRGRGAACSCLDPTCLLDMLDPVLALSSVCSCRLQVLRN